MAPVFLVTGHLWQIPVSQPLTHQWQASPGRWIGFQARTEWLLQPRHSTTAENKGWCSALEFQGMLHLGPWTFPVLGHATSLVFLWLASQFSMSQQARAWCSCTVVNSGHARCCHRLLRGLKDQAESLLSCSSCPFVFAKPLLSKQGSIGPTLKRPSALC